jgi:hypothetical protein
LENLGVVRVALKNTLVCALGVVELERMLVSAS